MNISVNNHTASHDVLARAQNQYCSGRCLVGAYIVLTRLVVVLCQIGHLVEMKHSAYFI